MEEQISSKEQFPHLILSMALAVRHVLVLPRIHKNDQEPIVIQEQGSFAVGGTVITNPGTFDPYNPTPAGQTFHGDHAYVFYQIPVKARKYPVGNVAWNRTVFQNMGNNT